MPDFESTSWAAEPPTRTGNGASICRMSVARASPASDIGSTEGITRSHVASPFASTNRADAGPAGATCAPSAYDPVTASTRVTPGTRDSWAA